MKKTKQPVSLFVTCLVDGISPGVGEAVVTVFERLGISVSCPPEQTCCGQPAFNSGYRTEARRAARRFIEVFEEADVIVGPSGSCVHMVKHHYPLLFDGDERWQARAKRVAEKTFEFTQYLVDVLGVTDLGAAFSGKVTYHDSCHLLRGLGIGSQPRKLIENVRGATFVEMAASDRCCGFGGAFSVKYPEISSAMTEEKVHNILASGADAVVGCDASCLMNIGGMLSRMGSSVRCLHIAELLAGDPEATR